MTVGFGLFKNYFYLCIRENADIEIYSPRTGGRRVLSFGQRFGATNFLCIMELDLRKSDIHGFGHTAFQEDGNLVVAYDVNDDSYHVNMILLRSVLKLFGEEYRIVKTEEWLEDDDFSKGDIWVYTNLPWAVFMDTPVDVDY